MQCCKKEKKNPKTLFGPFYGPKKKKNLEKKRFWRASTADTWHIITILKSTTIFLT
jgi:hypothetical protein